jgi:hypothetical protein
MSKVAHIQRTLFDPWLDWDQLPDEIREQALDVLTALYLEIVDVRQIGEQTDPHPSGGESTRSQRSAQHGVTNQ